MPLMVLLGLGVREGAAPLNGWAPQVSGPPPQWLLLFSDPRTADFARRHRDVIARFGRFPHRNAVLGRVSSAEELAFLQTPGSRF
jgi:alkanesulfonate monooxygenase SsuD/methylene tetrahydromethanopterin reductase-like flavin-dependent oxidoreductase (luciferase family)